MNLIQHSNDCDLISCLVLSVNLRHYVIWKFCSESAGLLLHCSALACEETWQPVSRLFAWNSNCDVLNGWSTEVIGSPVLSVTLMCLCVKTSFLLKVSNPKLPINKQWPCSNACLCSSPVFHHHHMAMLSATEMWPFKFSGSLNFTNLSVLCQCPY